MKINLLIILKTILVGMMLLLSLSVWFVTSSDQLRINNSNDPGSMYPVMMEGDAFIIFDVSPDSISVGDIIVYQIFVVNIDFIDNDEYIIHRVQAKIKIEEKYYFLLKGDNYISNSNLDNPGLSPDEYDSTLGNFIPEDQVIGKVYYRFSSITSSLLYALQDNSKFKNMLIGLVLSIITILFLFGNKIELILNQSFLNREIEFSRKKRMDSNEPSSETSKKGRINRKRGIVLAFVIVILFTQLYPLYIFKNLEVSESVIKDIRVSRQDDRFSIIYGEAVPYTLYRVYISIDIEYQPFTKLDQLEVLIRDKETNLVIGKGIWSPNVGAFSPNGRLQGEFNFSIFVVIYDDNLPSGESELSVTTKLTFRSLFRTLEIGGVLETPILYKPNPYLQPLSR